MNELKRREAFNVLSVTPTPGDINCPMEGTITHKPNQAGIACRKNKKATCRDENLPLRLCGAVPDGLHDRHSRVAVHVPCPARADSKVASCDIFQNCPTGPGWVV